MIYNIQDYIEETKEEAAFFKERTQQARAISNRFFSSIATRFFFVLLLLADIIWTCYAITFFVFKLVLNIVTLFLVRPLRNALQYSWLCFIRGVICFISLLIAIFSPAFGIMVACLYFLMYDKNGVEEIVPSSLRDQFRDFFPH